MPCVYIASVDGMCCATVVVIVVVECCLDDFMGIPVG